jgi:hypothetical protein
METRTFFAGTRDGLAARDARQPPPYPDSAKSSRSLRRQPVGQIGMIARLPAADADGFAQPVAGGNRLGQQFFTAGLRSSKPSATMPESRSMPASTG